VRDRYKGFLSLGRADWRVDVNIGGSGKGVADEVRLVREGTSERFTVARGDFDGVMDLGERRATLRLTDANEYSVDTFLRILYSLALLSVDGLIVHAASVIRKDAAYLFPGPSGSGKTTVARLSPDATLLSDELSIVRVSRHGAHCYGTPFWGELARAGEDRVSPLRTICFLRQSPRHAVESILPRRALERLLPNVLFFARDADLTARLLGVAAELVDAVPCSDLSFRPDAGFWEVIDRA
jgi:hypothetical protein